MNMVYNARKELKKNKRITIKEMLFSIENLYLKNKNIKDIAIENK